MGRLMEAVARGECGLREFVEPYTIFDLRFSFFYGLLRGRVIYPWQFTVGLRLATAATSPAPCTGAKSCSVRGTLST